MVRRSRVQLRGPFFAAIAGSSIFLGASVFATVPAKPVKLTCATSPLSTTFVVETIDEDVRVRVIHHNGPKYMPIHSSILTPNDLPMLAQKATELAKLGNLYELRWPLKSCKRTGEKRIECFGAPKQTVNGQDVEPWAIYSSKSTHETIAGNYVKYSVSLSLDIAGKSQNFSMEYGEDECFED